MDGVVFLWDLGRVNEAMAGSTFVEPGGAIAKISAGGPLRTQTPSGPARVTATFDHGGKRFVTAGATAELWKSADGRLIGHLRGHSGSINAVAFSDDDTLVATAGSDLTVRVWNPMSGAGVSVFRGHTRQITGLAFLTGSHDLVSVADDGTVRLWQTRPSWQDLVRKARQVLPRTSMTPAEELLVATGMPRTP